MKRVASVFLLSIFFFNITGYYIVFFTLNLQNKSHMSEMMENEEMLETIRIHRSELKSIVILDEGKEIYFKGEMYDIKDKSQDGDYIVFHCVNDKNEKKLRANLDKHIQNNFDKKSSSGEKQSLTKHVVKDLFCIEKNSPVQYSVSHLFETISYSLQTVHLPPFPLPPPEVYFS